MRKISNLSIANIEINEEFKLALDIMEKSSKNVFVTGRAGTGKSTLLEYFRQNTGKEIAVLAPTGVGAVNVRGQTIHSFFGFKPDITVNKIKTRRRKKDGGDSIYEKLDAIVIDEVSMVRADLLDCVDRFLRFNGPKKRRPFGGIQMIFIGDLYQLPPVLKGNERQIYALRYRSPYFFEAMVFEGFPMEFIELEKIYRQKDGGFIEILNAIRNNTIGDSHVAALNARLNPDFEMPSEDFYVYLTTTNAMAEEINERRLKGLKGRELVLYGEIIGDFGREYLPTPKDIALKEGAQIMLLNNDPYGRWVNGTIGEVKSVKHGEDGGDFITVRLSDGLVVDVTPFRWEIFKFVVENGNLESEVIGSFTQYPVKLAWAITIHKSQGKTFDKVIIDMGRGAFSHGQTYVALSRCTTLDGIVLKKPIKKEHVWMDWRVVDFVTKYQYKKSDEKCPLSEKVAMIERAIKNKARLSITYLKASDVKSKRIIKPYTVGEMEYQGKPFLGVNAFCLKRNEERIFRVDRILEIKELA